KRKFIIADAPGHEQYTRNMVTAASTAELAVLLGDAKKGITEQTRRHTYILWLLGMRHIVVAINKMDLISYSQARFAELTQLFRESTSFLLGIQSQFIPLCALTGENVTCPSRKMPWYGGPSLLQLLETIDVAAVGNEESLRFPVQLVIRPGPE